MDAVACCICAACQRLCVADGCWLLNACCPCPDIKQLHYQLAILAVYSNPSASRNRMKCGFPLSPYPSCCAINPLAALSRRKVSRPTARWLWEWPSTGTAASARQEDTWCRCAPLANARGKLTQTMWFAVRQEQCMRTASHHHRGHQYMCCSRLLACSVGVCSRFDLIASSEDFGAGFTPS